ncbi:DUF488 domain-containing protein [Falsibacillus albus]|uniref:DUF488 domain-containing protein n=1 Tax=Falsibacillus albus TaxID=2478915 RepID=A0A3L7K1D2_9BACI|nr:DUF488 domain-containing protein [Falsibacillus albus]RLQ94472.1 DUF488 domain-containing protein [Falsibacillus albus]
MFQMKRIYEAAEESDGKRVLTDRLWPRGVSKEKAKLDEWMKEIAPSTELRKSFCHDPEKFDQFREKYREELQSEEKAEAVESLKRKGAEGNVTLLYGAKDETYNHAIVLKEFLEGKS